jgi:multiple sugar transport system permease protein
MTVVFTGGEDGLPSGPSSLRGVRGTLAKREMRWGIFFVAPWIIGFLAFYLIPLVASFVLSFTDYQLASDEPTSFVGLDNWRELFEDDRVEHGLWVTLKYSVLAVPASLLVPLGFAYLLTAKHLWGRSLFRVLFYLPTMVPFIASVIVWRFYLNPQSGWMAKLLGVVGIDSPDFIRSETWIMPGLTLITLWGVGNAMIIFIASLNSVPTQLYEAAKIDGAGNWRLFRDVTWPMISPITFYNLVIVLVGIGQYFAVPFALTTPNGGVNNIALFYTMHFYNETFVNFRLGYGSALAWAMFIVVVALTAALFWSARYWVHYEYEER